MTNSRRGYNGGFHGLVTLDLDDRREQHEEGVQEVPLKITEERIRTEWEHGANPRHLDSVPLLIERPAPAATRQADPAPMGTALAGGAAPANDLTARGLNQDLQNSPARTGSILGLDNAPAAPAPRPSGTWQLRRRSRVPWGLWTAILLLSLTLGGAVAYSYAALQRNSVVVSELPGAATVRTIRAQAASARSDVEQSGFYRDSAAVGNRARPAVAAAWHRVEQAAGSIYDRYEQWRARR